MNRFLTDEEYANREEFINKYVKLMKDADKICQRCMKTCLSEDRVCDKGINFNANAEAVYDTIIAPIVADNEEKDRLIEILKRKFGKKYCLAGESVGVQIINMLISRTDDMKKDRDTWKLRAENTHDWNVMLSAENEQLKKTIETFAR